MKFWGDDREVGYGLKTVCLGKDEQVSSFS